MTERTILDGQEFFARRRLWLVVVAVAMLAACADEFPCDPDQMHVDGVCFAIESPAPTADANPAFAHFGDVCATDDECELPTSFCVKQPGETSGYCTGVGCLTEPAVCPADWSCTDLSVFAAGLPSICGAP